MFKLVSINGTVLAIGPYQMIRPCLTMALFHGAKLYQWDPRTGHWVHMVGGEDESAPAPIAGR